MGQGLKTAASITLATTCVATAPLRSEGGEMPLKTEIRQCQRQGLVGISCDGIGTALPVSNQETRETDGVADCDFLKIAQEYGTEKIAKMTV